MIYGIIVSLHVLICILLIFIVLIQSGRGGGLVESFSGMESIFGTKTPAFITKLTAILAIIFFLTCLILAYISKQESKPLMDRISPDIEESIPLSNTIK